MYISSQNENVIIPRWVAIGLKSGRLRRWISKAGVFSDILKLS